MILEMLLTSSVLILAVLAIRAVFGRSMGARLRYGLWLLVLLRLLLPVSIGKSAVSPANLARQDAAGTVWTTPLVTGTPEDLGVRVNPATGALYDANSMGYPADNGDGTVTRYAGKHTPPDVLPLVWAVGMGAAALWFALCNLLFWNNLRRSRTLLRTEGRTRIYLADVPSPCLFGLFRPAVYVTAEAAADPEALSHVLLHETTHLRHGDQLWAVLRTVCLVVWWFNPLVWIAAEASRRDCELCCDEAVIRQVGAERRTAYGRTLVDLAGGRRRPVAAFCAVTTLSGGRGQLKRRVQAIARWARPRKWAVTAAILAGLLASACAFAGARGETPAVGRLTAAEAMDALGASVAYGAEQVSFTVPAGYPAAADWKIDLRGRAVYEDGFSRSLHPLEEEAGGWRAGRTYTVPLDNVAELLLTYSLPGAPERTVSLWPVAGPITDADFVTAAGAAFGMSYDRVVALVGTPDERLDGADGIRSFWKDGILYAFYEGETGADFLLSGLSTDRSTEFLALGMGVGDRLEDVLTRLGAADADPDGAAEQQLYGEPGGVNAAVLARTGTGWVLSAWAQTCGLQATFDGDGILRQLGCYGGPVRMAAAAGARVSDAALRTADGAALGMSYDQVVARIGQPEKVINDSKQIRMFRKDHILYTFHRDAATGDLLLRDLSTAGETNRMPLGIGLGDSMEQVLGALGLQDVSVEAPEALQLYGAAGLPNSADLRWIDGQNGYELSVWTERGGLGVSFDETGRVQYYRCYLHGPDDADLRTLFLEGTGAGTQVVGIAAAPDRAYDLLGVILYTDPTEPEQLFSLGFATDLGGVVFNPVGIGQPEDGTVLELAPEPLRYLGGGAASVTVREAGTGTLREIKISFSRSGSNLYFVTEDGDAGG